jgi:hypothetical protein
MAKEKESHHLPHFNKKNNLFDEGVFIEVFLNIYLA